MRMSDIRYIRGPVAGDGFYCRAGLWCEAGRHTVEVDFTDEGLTEERKKLGPWTCPEHREAGADRSMRS